MARPNLLSCYQKIGSLQEKLKLLQERFSFSNMSGVIHSAQLDLQQVRRLFSSFTPKKTNALKLNMDRCKEPSSNHSRRFEGKFSIWKVLETLNATNRSVRSDPPPASSSADGERSAHVRAAAL